METKMTHIELFLSFVGAGSAILAIGFSNWILGTVTVLCGVFVLGAYLIRKKRG